MTDVRFSYADPAAPRLKRGFIHAIEAATGRGALKRLYLDHRAAPGGDESFWQAAVRLLALDVRFDAAALAAIPAKGPVVIVANHPYGVLDGIVISWLAEKVRPDFRVLTHSLLLRAPEARPNLLPVDFSGTGPAQRTNMTSRAAALELLGEGGCVVIFPAGGISTAPDRLGRLPATDAPWHPFAAQLVQRTGATVVPIYFSGQNSRLFQIASHVSLTLRLSLIFREVKNRIGTRVPVVIGDPVPFESLAAKANRQALCEELRSRVYGLAEQAAQPQVPAITTAARAPFARLIARRQIGRRGVAETAQPRPR